MKFVALVSDVRFDSFQAGGNTLEVKMELQTHVSRDDESAIVEFVRTFGLEKIVELRTLTPEELRDMTEGK